MKFSSVVLLSATAGYALAGFANTTTTETDKHTTVITVTSCEEDKCTEIPITTGLTTVTEEFTTYTTYCPLSTETDNQTFSASLPILTITTSTSFADDLLTTVTTNISCVTITSCNEEKCTEIPTGLTTVTEEFTTYTTYCPLSTETEKHTTVITITSCKEDKCTEIPHTTGLTTVTEDFTTYTTYCPLPTTEAPVKPTTEAPVKPTTEAPVKPTTEAPVKPTTEAPVKPTTLAPTTSKTKAPQSITTSEGAAAKVVPGVAAAMIAAVAFLY